MLKRTNTVVYHTLLIILVVCVVECLAESPKRKIRVGIFNNQPIVFINSQNTPQGIYVDLLNEISGQEGWNIEYVFGSWSEGLDRLKNQEIDLMTSIAYTEERANYLDFSSENVLNMWGQVYHSDQRNIDDIFALQGLRVTALRGGINNIHFQELMRLFDIEYTLVEVNSYAEAVELVASQNADACVLNNIQGYVYKNTHNIVASPIVFNPFRLLFAAPKGRNGDILTTIDGYLNKWKNDPKSVYFTLLEDWHAGVETVKYYIPRWMKYLAVISVAVVIVSLFWISLLYFQISIRKRTEKALEESENRFRSLSDATFEGVVITHGGIIIEANTSVCNTLGYDPDEIIGKKIVDIILPEEKANVEGKMLSGYEKSYETRFRKKDGSIVSIEVQGKMFSYKGQEVRVAAVRDLTERKEAELERERLIVSLQDALAEVQTLRGILPICSFCKKIRNDDGYYEQIEAYIHRHSGVDFSHTVCPSCFKENYPEMYKEIHQKKK